MNNQNRLDSRFNNYLMLLSTFFFTMFLTQLYFRADALGFQLASVLLLLAGLSIIAAGLGLYLGRKMNAIIEQLKIANEIPSIDEGAVEPEETEIE